MNNTNKVILIIVAVIVVVVAVWYGIGKKSTPTVKEPIKLGFVAPLTGDAASYGQGEKQAIELAIEEINSAGGIDGVALEVIFEDGKCNGKDAVTATIKLINIDEVKIILGGGCSGETLAMAPITEKSKVILFSSFSTSPLITEAGDYVFRNAPSDIDSGKAGAEMMFKDGHRRIAILTENTDYTQELKRVLIESIEELKAEVVADEIYELGSRDYRVQLLKIKENNPDVIFFNAQTGVSGGLAVKQAKELGVDVPYYGTGVFSSGDALTGGGVATNGLKFVDVAGLSEDNSKAVIFLEKYLEKYSNPSSEYEIGARYDSVYLIADALKLCAAVNTDCIKNYLYNLSEYDGVIGKYRFDQNGDVVGIKYIIKQVVDAEKGDIIEVK